MIKVALKNLRGHKLRTLFTAFAIALGVGFMAGTYVLTDTISSAFDELFSEANAGIDAVVQGAEPFESSAIETGGQRPDIDPAIADLVAGVDGVAVAEPGVFGFAYLLDEEGSPYVSGGAPSFGANWTGTETAGFTIVRGEAPEGPTQVMIDEATADRAGLDVGDEATVQTLTGTFPVEIVSIGRFGESGSLVGSAFVLMDTRSAIDLFTPNGLIQSVYVIAEPGLSEQDMVDRIAPVLPDGIEVVTAEESSEESQALFDQILGFFNTFLTAVGLVSLAAGAFLIYNTFGIIIGQRNRELALLRALGAGRRQVLASVLAESVVIGLIASLLGLVGGIALAFLLINVIAAIGIDLPSTTPVVALRTIVLAMAVGTAITVLSSLAPALRASRIAPMAALRETATERPSRSIVRLVIGLVILALGVFVMVRSVADGEAGWAAASIVAIFAGVVVLGPFIVPTVVAGLAAPARLLGFAGRLGGDNARRNPRRSAGTAASLMLAVTIITFIAVNLFSFTASFSAATDKYLKADLEVQSGQVPILGQSAVEALAALPEVRAATGVQRGQVQIDGTVRPVYAVTASAVLDIFDLQGVEGDLAGMGTDGIAIDRVTAEEQGLAIGDTVEVLFPDSTEATLTVAAIYEDGGIIAQNSDGHYLIDVERFTAHFGANNQFMARIDVRGVDGVDLAQLRAAVEAELEAFPTATVLDKDELRDQAQNQVLQVLGFLFVLLGLALVIGALGVTITLALSVFERTHEIGLLRAVGTTRGQLGVAVLVESIVLTLLGTVLGLVIGIVGAVAVVRSQADLIDTLQVSVPWGFLVLVVVIAVGIGVAASIVPGWRAARMDVLEAVSAE